MENSKAGLRPDPILADASSGFAGIRFNFTELGLGHFS